VARSTAGVVLDDQRLGNHPRAVRRLLRQLRRNTFDRLSTHDNYETGFQLQGASAGNLILNLDSYNNRDPRKNGESADGLGIKEGSGIGNVVRAARLWNNIDDGFDFDGGSTARLTANLAVGNATAVAHGSSTATGNSWNIGTTWTLLSTDPAVITGPRNADGSIPSSAFLVPANGAAVGAKI
jgi:hypothetical protein